MLKILVVDDEYLVRLGIKETIEWKKYGFEICGEARNGEEGFEKYLELKPDIIITDIRMKKATGLDLIRKIKNTNDFKGEIVILTAYSEFDYVKTALENGAAAYILKPIQEKELISTMLEVKEKIVKRRKENHIIKNLSGHVPYLKNKFLFNILNGTTVNIKEIKENCEFYEIELPKEEFTVASIRVDNIQALSVAKSMIQENLTETVEYCSCMPDGLKLISCMPDDFSMALVIFYHDDNYKLLKSSFSILVNFLTSIKDQFQAGSGETVSIGYSGGYVGIENIAKAYSEAHKAAMYKSFVGNNSLISFDSVPREMSGALVISNSDINAVLAAIRSGDRDEAFSILNKFYVKIKNTPAIDVESLRDVVLEMIIILLRYTFENNDAIDDIYGRNLLPYNEIKTLETVDDIIKWINAIVGKMFLKTKDKDDEQSKKVIDIIKRDYASAITVQQVADELYISAYYLMHIFKEQTGKTFNQFVTEYRIKRAKEFIKRDEYKIYEIGSMVGYKDPTYFSYIFKKVTGETPKKYAKSHNVLSLNERS